MAAVLVIAAATLTGATLFTAQPAEAATGSDFNPGNIISDAVFYNGDSMVPSQIQEFLNSKVSSCTSGYTCLKSFTENTSARAADRYCTNNLAAATAQSAANIIYAVGQACGVNPQVLLVTLQKEQALVTRTSPSTAAYLRAMGYGCPDTAACNTEYFGFSNQVYKAARQFKIYRASPTSFNYRAGRTNTILYNPNAACGTSSVYIENQATAGLYTYTPYQPNAAALANLYGTGDSCSAYGNRNFWRIFSDWFGSTQGGGTLVRTVADPTIYLVTADRKYPVKTMALFNSLQALGPFQYASQAYLDQFTTGAAAGNLLRDPTTLYIYLAANGQKNKFPTCAMISTTWGLGSSCGAYIDVMPSQILKFVTGKDVTPFPLSSSTGIIYSMLNGTKRAVHSFAQIDKIANGGSSAYTSFPQATLNQFATGPDVLDAGSVVRTAASSQLYLLTNSATSTLVPIPSAEMYANFGLSGYTVSSDLGLAASTISTSPLSIAVTCGTQQYIAGNKVLWAIPQASGLPTTQIDTANCAALKKSPTSISGALFMISPAGNIWNVSGGKKQFMTSMSEVARVNGSGALAWIPQSEATLAAIPTRPTALTAATLVKSASSSTVYFINGVTSKIPLSAFDVAKDFGITSYSVVSDASLAEYPTTGSPLSVSVTCGSLRYIAGGSSLTAITAADAGMASSALDAATCAALPKSSNTVTGALFLRLPSGNIYYISAGVKHFVTTMANVYSINGSNPLVLIPTNGTTLASIPSGASI